MKHTRSLLMFLAISALACRLGARPAPSPTQAGEAAVVSSAQTAAPETPALPPAPPLQSTAAPPSTQVAVGHYIDVHMHLDGMNRSGSAIVKDYETAAENLIALMDQYDVASALVMPPPQYPGQPGAYDFHNLLGAVADHPGRLYLVAGGGTLNPLIVGTEASDVTDQLRAEFESRAEAIIADGAAAFGEMAALHLCMQERHHFIAAPPNHPLFLLLADIAARHGVPIDLHMEAVPEDMPTPANLLQACSQNPSTLDATIPPLEELLAHNRDAKIVWQHIGWDNIGYMTADLMRRLLTEHPNLYLALKVEEREVQVESNDPMPNRIVDESGQIRPEWMQLISDFPDRILIGADEFIGIPGATPTYPQSFEEIWPILDQLPPDLAAQVGRDNAPSVYNLR
ncbi:MAG: amidohydrolase family protein [Anaerolineales bacterium]